jgi:hypothetical protein
MNATSRCGEAGQRSGAKPTSKVSCGATATHGCPCRVIIFARGPSHEVICPPR